MTEPEVKKEIARVKKIVHDYIDGVLSGTITACRFTKLACKRHLNDLKDGPARGLLFREDKAYHAVKFFSFLKLWKGKEYKGKEFALAPHRVFITWVLMGWYRSDGTRRFRKAYDEEARKSAKTTYVGGIEAYFLIADGEEAAECYCAAVKRDQAKLVWDNVKNLTKDTGFAKNITYLTNKLTVDATNSKCEPLSSDAKSLDGLDTHFASLDELHAHPDGRVYNLIDDSIGARRQPMIFVITTAGFNQSGVCYEMRDYLTKILKETVSDDSFFGIIFTLDTKKDWPDLKEAKEEIKEGEEYEDDWTNEDVWVKAAPALIGVSESGKKYGLDENGDPVPGYMTKIEDMRDKCRIAKQVPSEQNNFLTKRLNIWTQQENRWLSLPLWDANNIRPVTEETCRGRSCVGGIDLSAISDLTVWGMLFPDETDKDLIDILFRVWCPEAKLFDTKNRYRDQYKAWRDRGFLTVTPGDAIDYDMVRGQIAGYTDVNGVYVPGDKDKFNIQSISVDRGFQGYEFSQRLDKELGGDEKNPKVIACGMGWVSMNGPCQEFERLLLLKKLNHGGNPIARFAADNVAVKINPTGGGKSPNKAALAINTPIPSPYGWIPIGEVSAGDVLFDEKGDTCRVINTTDIFLDRKCFRVDFSDETNIVADAGHFWKVFDNKLHKEVVATTEELSKNITHKHQFRYAINNSKPLILPEQDFILDPYLLGAWLGDGSSSTGNITGMDEEIFEEFRKKGFDLIFQAKRSKATTYRVKGLTRILYELGILNCKRIPEGYLRGSAEQRLSLLQGLMDTDGCCSKSTGVSHGNGGYIQFINTNEDIIDGVFELLASLGMKSIKKIALNAGRYGRNNQAWRVSCVVYNDLPVFRLERKYSLQLPPPARISRYSKRQIIAITPIPPVPVKCISVDSPSNLFLAGKSMIATHNSSQGKIDPIIVILLGLDRLLRVPAITASAYEGLTLDQIRAARAF